MLINKVLIIPDSFKGTMSSGEICDIMEASVRRFFPLAQAVKILVADGGEGSVDAFLTALGGEKRYIRVKGPYFHETDAFYGALDNGATAVIEMAAAAGLPLVGEKRNPAETTTYGVGQLMRKAVKSGAKRLIVGLGGSATNDAGAGAAAAAGIRFFNRDGNLFVPVGKTLVDIEAIDVSGLDPLFRNVEITTMCDIDNPLCGPSGAAFVFGPQKGADNAMVSELDRGLSHIADITQKLSREDYRNIPGAGAAGGMGFGMKVFFGSELRSGIETVLDTVKFDELLHNADLVFTGEGKIDAQSLRGKVVIGVAKRAGAAGVPVIAVVGDIGDDINGVYDAGVSAVFSINRVATEFKNARLRAKSDLELTTDNLMRFISLTGANPVT